MKKLLQLAPPASGCPWLRQPSSLHTPTHSAIRDSHIHPPFAIFWTFQTSTRVLGRLQLSTLSFTHEGNLNDACTVLFPRKCAFIEDRFLFFFTIAFPLKIIIIKQPLYHNYKMKLGFSRQTFEVSLRSAGKVVIECSVSWGESWLFSLFLLLFFFNANKNLQNLVLSFRWFSMELDETTDKLPPKLYF